jgi:hypothetical protein
MKLPNRRIFVVLTVVIALLHDPDVQATVSSASCPISASTAISASFNSTSIQQGNYIWFDANFTASGIPTNGATIFFQNSTVSFSALGQAYVLRVPNAVIIFSPTASCAVTSFNTSAQRWETTVPVSGSNEIFLSGMAFPVPVTLPGGINPVTWTGIFSTTAPAVSIKWKWGAAVYTRFPLLGGGPDYNSLGVNPTHGGACIYQNSDHAGTPENVTAYIAGGATGDGGENFTGSWSGTQAVPTFCGNVSDNFNRADGLVGSNWQSVAEEAMTISNNEIADPSGTSYAGGYWAAGIFTSDQYSQAQIPSDSGIDYHILMVRGSGSDSTNRQYYQLYWDSTGKLQIGFYANNNSFPGGYYRDIGAPAFTPKNPGDILRFEAVGSTLRAYVNGVLQISTSDAVLSSGAPGIVVHGSARFDNWTGANLP